MVQQEGRGNPTHYAQMDEQEREATILGYADTWRLVVQQQLYKQKESWLVHTILCRSFLYTRQRGMSMVLLGRKKTQFHLFSAHCNLEQHYNKNFQSFESKGRHKSPDFHANQSSTITRTFSTLNQKVGKKVQIFMQIRAVL